MNLYRKVPWHHGDNHYEIRVYFDDRQITVAVFLNHRPATGYRHIIQIPKSCDARKLLEKHLVPELVEASKRDIAENQWETLKTFISLAKRDEM